MSDLEDRLRRDLPRLCPPIEGAPAFARVERRRRRLRMRRRIEVAGLAVAVLGAVAGGAFALVQAFGGPDPRPGAAPSASDAPEPTQSPSPVASPSPSPTETIPGFPAECDASQVAADFDGDGRDDVVVIHRARCLYERPGYAEILTDFEFAMRVTWGGGSSGVAGMADCTRTCTALGAGDLDGDGAFELFAAVDEWASTLTLQVFELPQSEAFGDPSTVAAPGAPGFPANEPARIPYGGSATLYAALGCEPASHEAIVETAELNEEQTEYSVNRTVLRFDQTPTPPFGELTVVSTSEHTEPFDPDVGPGDLFEPGAPCWMEGG